MRINKLIASRSRLSRRAADQAIANGRVFVDGEPAQAGQDVAETATITLDGHELAPQTAPLQTIMFHKPAGYVTSRRGQGSKTIYDLLPSELRHLKPVGRLDKNSSGLLLLTNDGELAYQLTHPSFHKVKIYEVALNKPLAPLHHQMIHDHGVQLEDGLSRLTLEKLNDTGTTWRVTMHEGRNRQIRRTFAALGYAVTRLHRTQFGDYQLDDLPPGSYNM